MKYYGIQIINYYIEMIEYGIEWNIYGRKEPILYKNDRI